MSLSGALTAYAELVGDVLVNQCGRPTPTRLLRYHGHAVPDEICGEGSNLSVWWEAPLSPKEAAKPCSGPPVVTLSARWVECWKLPNYNETSGAMQFDSDWDAHAGVLADTAECVARALMRLSCATPTTGPDGEKAAAFLAIAMTDSIRFINASPAGPLGGIAGVVWRTSLSLKAIGESS